MKKLMITMCVALASLYGFTQKDFKLQFVVKGFEKDTVYLIRYYGEKMFYADTAVADVKGAFSFKGKFAKEGGTYAVMPSDKSGYFEVLLNDEDVTMETQKGDYVGNMKVLKSKENQLFYQYVKFISEKSKAAEPLRKELEAATTEDAKKASREKLKVFDDQVKAEQKRIMKENNGTLVALMIRLSTDIDVPEPPKDNQGRILDSAFQRNYYISHYWDDINTGDERLIRMPGYQKKLDYFFDKILIQLSDSIIPHCEKIIKPCKEGSEIFKFNVVHLTSKYQNSKIMCQDKVFVHMVLTYYKTKKSFWMPEDKNKEIVERAEAMSQVVCGAIAHDIVLPDTTQTNWVRISTINAKYRILVFWDPDCGHCKKEMPKLVEKYEELKKMGVEVIAVSSDNNAEWRKFVKDKNMKFINIAVPRKVYEDQNYANEVVLSKKSDLKSLNYHQTFDIFKTPTVFILNKKGEIIGKNLEADGILDFLKRIKDNDLD